MSSNLDFSNSTSTADDLALTLTLTLPLLNHTDRLTPEGIQRLATLSVLLVVTFVGNSALIAVLASSTKYRTLNRRVNVFIVNLAAGDLSVCGFTITSEILFVVHEKNWVLGDLACRTILYVQIVTLASTTFILTAMSIDRYLVVSRPLRFGAGGTDGAKRATRMIVCSWGLALVFAIPQVFIWKQESVGVYLNGQVKHECASRGYSAWWQRKAYFTFMATYILVLPTVIITFCYANVVRAVWKQANQTPSWPTTTTTTTRVLKRGPYAMGDPKNRHPVALVVKPHGIPKARIQTIKMTFCIITSFIACWTPYFVVRLVHIWTEYRSGIPQTVFALADTVALLNSAVNPLLYACFTVKLKRKLRRVFCSYCRRKNRGAHRGPRRPRKEAPVGAPQSSPGLRRC